jgi:hypothetical protein
MKSYTYQDLKALLEAECPDEFMLVSSIKDVTFLPTTTNPSKLPFVPTCGKHLQFGKIGSPILEYRDSVFIYIGSEGNNRISLVCGGENTKIELTQAVLIEPTKPFWFLCSHGRVIDAAKMKRVKALACFLFLAGGHVQTVQHYSDFNEDLVDAIVWYGRGLETESRSTTKTAGPNYGPVKASKKTASTDKQRRGKHRFGSAMGPDLPIRAVSQHSDTAVGVEQREHCLHVTVEDPMLTQHSKKQKAQNQ